MNRGKRLSLIFGFAALIVLVAAVAALSLWPEEDPQPDDTPSPSETTTYDLLKETQDNIQSVLFTPREGSPYTLKRDAASGDCTLEAASAVFPGKQSMMRSTYTYATSLTFVTPVTENADDTQLASFGLDKPVMTWKLTRTDGTTLELAIGSQSVTGTGRYARKKNERAVYLLNDLQSAYLTKSLEELYDLTFLPFAASTEEAPTWNLIQHCLLQRVNDTIEITQRTEEELTNGSLGMSTFFLTQPGEGEGNDYTIQKTVLEPITAIAPSTVAASHPPDLSPYGLDTPARLTLTDGNGWSGTLLIGSAAPEGGHYVMIEGYDAVLIDSACDYRFLTTDYTYLRSQTIWLHDIKTVSSMTLDLQGTSHTLTFEHNVEEETLRGFLNGTEVTETNARRMYVAALRIAQDGATDAEVPAGEPDYRITIHFTEGGSDSIELYALNELQYLIVRGGKNLGLFINKTSFLHAFLNRFDLLERGEDLPRL